MNARAYAWLSAVLAAACSGTDTGNPPLAFDSSGCKGAPRSEALMTTKGIEPQASVHDPEHDGFVCTLWERTDDERLRIEFTNYTAGCGADEGWRPRVKQADDGALEIYLDHTDCVFAGCGYCIYDLSLTAPVPAQSGDLEVRLFGDTCSGPAVVGRSATLPLAVQRSGALCTHYRPRAFGEGALSCNRVARWGYCFPGQVAMCPEARPVCEDGLECTPVDESNALCLPTCASDGDCKDAGPTHCEDGVCKL